MTKKESFGGWLIVLMLMLGVLSPLIAILFIFSYPEALAISPLILSSVASISCAILLLMRKPIAVIITQIYLAAIIVINLISSAKGQILIPALWLFYLFTSTKVKKVYGNNGLRFKKK